MPVRLFYFIFTVPHVCKDNINFGFWLKNYYCRKEINKVWLPAIVDIGFSVLKIMEFIKYTRRPIDNANL